MSFTKGVMVNGGFTLAFRADTPSQVLDACDIAANGFAHVVATRVWFPADVITAATLLEKSIYTGVLFSNRARYQIGGLHATSWLGDPSGIGDINERGTTPLTGNFQQWVDGLVLAGTSCLDTGTVVNLSPGTTMTWDPLLMLPREMLDHILEYFRTAIGDQTIEWRVNDDLTVDAGTADDLYTSTPVAMLTATFDGPDALYPGLNASLEYDDDVDDYINRLHYTYDSGSVWRNGAATPYSDGFGNDVARKRKESNTDTTSAQANNVADSIVALDDQARRQLSASTDRRAVMADVPCGSYVYAWDQAQRIVGDTGVAWRGTIANPAATRVMEITMPFETGMGCYLLVGGTTVYDLTRWIVPESPGATLKLGELDRPLVYR